MPRVIDRFIALMGSIPLEAEQGSYEYYEILTAWIDCLDYLDTGWYYD